MTVPAAEAWTGVPLGTAMSTPSCMRPQRHPNGLVTGPDTGHWKPPGFADGDDGDVPAACPAACAAWIFPATAALFACSASIAPASPCSGALILSRLTFFWSRAAASEP